MPENPRPRNSPRTTTTLKPALWVLGTVAVAQIAAVGWSFASRVQLAPLGGTAEPLGQGGSEIAATAPAMAVPLEPGEPVPRQGVSFVPGEETPTTAAEITEVAAGYDPARPTAGGTGVTAPPPFSVDTEPLPTGALDEPPSTLTSTDPTAILNTTAATHVRNGNTLRSRGDTQAALEQYRLALLLLPSHPRILYEIASTYESMGLAEKASERWEQIYRLGEGAGELFVLADLKLRGSDGTASLSDDRPIAIGSIRTIPDTSADDGSQRVVLQISLKAKDGVPIDTSLFEAHVHFFDRVDGGRIDQTTADPPVSRWITGPDIDWANFAEEVLEVVYFHPAMSNQEISQFGSREYYGYIVKLYYDNRLIDQAAEPRTLFEYLFQGSAIEPKLDNSLFLND